jgi:nicotinamide-nucleotide amidase
MDVARELKELLLKKPPLTLAVAESLTAGHVQARIAGVSGASNFFLGGVTAYSLEEKVKLLGVKAAEAKKVDCVSATVAEQMARGVCRLFSADVGLATTGYAEPNAKEGVPVPMAWWALAHRRHGKFVTRHGRVECPGSSRTDVQAFVAAAVLVELAEYLRELRG